MELEKFFDFLKDEKNLYSQWEKLNCFKPKKGGEPYSIMMPPPNVTGSLHMGHALTFTIQDILIRYHRMKGMEVLWQAGTDHAGIATQMVVERKLSESNLDRRSLGREKFIEKVWEWKKESGGLISNQLRRLGASADWSRERFTMDEGLSNAVKKVFVNLYNDGIIYKDKRLVNWDPKLLTAISDLEVEQKDTEGSLWHIKYPIDENNHIIVATTRPETMLGDTAVAVHPDDEKYKNLIGKFCNLPISNKKIPIITDEYADPEKGSGAVKITPAHDFNDFEVGKRHNLEFINIFDENAKLNLNTPKEFQNLDRFDARKLILKKLQEMNLLVKEEKQQMVIPYGDRSGVVIEPWLTDQWFCDAKKLSVDPISAVKNNSSKFIPKQWENTFYNWMENIQPWCISRQLWWGHQIPAWYGPDNKFFVNETLEEAKKQAKEFYGKDVELRQDEDVLDTWFSSALWTFSTLDWPNKTYELEKFYPGNVLVTGFDIIFFWVARMMMMGSYFIKQTPFKDIYIHPLIRDEKGQKMSKSKGNIIDPLDLLDKYGADTLRFTLTALLNPGRDVKLSEARVKGYKSFINKIWNAGKFLQINNSVFKDDIKIDEISFDANKWIIKELAELNTQLDQLTKKYSFHEIANKIYHFVWHSYCDWYIEIIKQNFNNKKYADEIKKVSGWTFIQVLKIIHPIMPFISEKLWRSLVDNQSFLMNQIHHNYTTNNSFNISKNYFEIFIEFITSIRNLRSELNIPYKKLINVFIEVKNEELNKFLFDHKNEINYFLKTKDINFEKIKPNNNSALIVLTSLSVLIPLEGIIDSAEEIKKLNRKKDIEQDKFNKVNDKLNNENFMNKASEEIIDKFKNERKIYKSSIEKIEQIINTIN
ncbi:MAG: valine--tRNA ligase [Pelagibacteraceae bacterium TMED237]|nr:MAG: valine--tRNA ligase [Pelagibacteraceae bacterium TMED237]